MSDSTVAVQVPEAIYRRLERLAALTSRPLESLVAQALSSGMPPLPDDLRERRRAGIITEPEQHALTSMAHEADLLMLRKAYAGVLLKWRGQKVPTLAELEA